MSPLNLARMSYLPYILSATPSRSSQQQAVVGSSDPPTSVFAKAYPTTVGTKMTYMNEIQAVRGVQRKYFHRSLFNSVDARQPLDLYSGVPEIDRSTRAPTLVVREGNVRPYFSKAGSRRRASKLSKSAASPSQIVGRGALVHT